MNKRIIIFLIILVTSIFISKAQGKMDVNKDIDVITVYEQVVKEGYGTTLIYKELANAYYFKSNYDKAKVWFEKLFDEEKPPDKTLLFRYKQSLKALGVYSEDNLYLSIGDSH
jgi:tetratricopeptide (TPR) repeat protein